MVRLRFRLPGVFAVVGLVFAMASLTYGVVVGISNTRQINNERAHLIRSSCVSQNQRHDNTIATLNRLTREAMRRHPHERASLRERYEASVLLINALAPKRNCETLVTTNVKATR